MTSIKWSRGRRRRVLSTGKNRCVAPETRAISAHSGRIINLIFINGTFLYDVPKILKSSGIRGRCGIVG